VPRTLKICITALLFGALLLWRLDWLVHQPNSTQFVGSAHTIAGVVRDDPDTRDSGVHIFVGDVLAVLPTGTPVAYGDRVVLQGSIEAPQVFVTNTGHLFDYPGYLKTRGVVAVMPHAQLVSDTPGGVSPQKFLFDIKHAFEHSLTHALPQPQAALLMGILLGERGGLSNYLLQMFVVVGLIHIVVLSGSNVSIVAEAIFRTLGFLPRTPRYVLGVVGIVLFAIMTGGGSATLRAVIMGGIAVVARYLRRPNDALRALMLAGAVMLLYNPYLVLDNGFVLSMLATFGLITVSPTIERHLGWVPAWASFNLRSIVATTLGVEIFILPSLLYYSGVLSFVSVPANALIVPVVPVVMLFGFVTGVLGMIHPALAVLPGVVTDVLLRIVLVLAQLASNLPHAATVVAAFPLWLALLCYVPLTYMAAHVHKRSKQV